jgi:hypothetical protein
MIYVKRNSDESSQKVVGQFLKRVKRYNLINRSRKTQFRSKPLSHLKKKQKAVSKAAYLRQQEIDARSAR